MSDRTYVEKPIPSDAPGRLIAQYLRLLRRLAGSPSYRKLAPIAGVTQNALSQLANGQRIIIRESMETYVDAVTRYARKQSIDLALAMRGYAEQFQVDPDGDIRSQARAVHARNVAMIMNRPPQTGEAARTDLRIPGPPPPDALSEVDTVDDLVGVLNDMIMLQLGWDVSARSWDAHRVGVPPYLLTQEARDALTRRRALSDVVFARILQACGAGDFTEQDQVFVPHHAAWTVARQRTMAADEQINEPVLGDAGGGPVERNRWRVWLRRLWSRRPHRPAPVAAGRAPAQRSAEHDSGELMNTSEPT